MANQKTHRKANTILIITMLISIFILQPIQTILLSLGTLTGYFINPDLDKPRKGFLGLTWYPYCLLFKHRGLSHNLIFGTLTRITYIFILITIITTLTGNLHNIHKIIQDNLNLILYFIGGLWVSDLLHIIMDKTMRN